MLHSAQKTNPSNRTQTMRFSSFVFTRQLMLGVTEEENENIELKCGRKYKCYLKDCYPIMMQGKKFVVKDSTLIDIGTGELYIKER